MAIHNPNVVSSDYNEDFYQGFISKFLTGLNFI